MRFPLRVPLTATRTRASVLVAQVAVVFVLWLPVLVVAPPGAAQALIAVDHPVMAMENLISRHGMNSCDAYGVNDLTWAQFR
ncbi:MAG TPA: hypothetical protein VFQ80_12245 [Thermomicrobiales bacterium]|jgi:hypothetical protein|nr:hypothetical protein [Thermomicrobiales bacterium]